MEAVTLMCGELPRYFQWGASNLNYATANGNSLAIRKERVYSTFQGIVSGTGAVTATFTVFATNDEKTAHGFNYGCATSNGSTTVTSGALFNGYIDPISTAWIPPVAIGDLISGPGIPAAATVTAIASASSLTISAAATASQPAVNLLIQGTAWATTVLGTITLNGTNTASDGFSTAAAWRWVRGTLASLTGTNAIAQLIMGV